MACVAVIPRITVFNFALHDIFSLDKIHWVGLDWHAGIVAAPDFRASFRRSLLFSALVLSVQVLLGTATALLPARLGRAAVPVLLLTARPLIVPWSMIPVMWLNPIGPRTGRLAPVLHAAGVDHKFTAPTAGRSSSRWTPDTGSASS